MLARAQGAAGGLFSDAPQPRPPRPDDPATTPAPAAEPEEDPIGSLAVH
jgi:hypothetical protein